MITVKDVRGHFLLANPAFARAVGREPEDLVGRTAYDVVAPALADVWSAHDRQVVDSGVALHAPERFPGEQGEVVDCIATKFPLLGPGGDVVAVGSLRVPIGDLEEARDALDASERRYQALFEQSTVGQLELDGTGRVIAINPTAAHLLGHPGTPPLGLPAADVLRTPAGDRLHEDLRGVLAGAVPEHRGLHHLDGPPGERRAVLVSATPVRAAGGRVVGALVGLVDSSDRERAESRLLLSEQRSRSLLRSMPDAVVVVDAAGRVREVNHQTEVLFGYSAAELLGRPVERLVPPEGRSSHPARRSSYVAQDSPEPMSTGDGIVGLRKDGSRVPVQISLAAVTLEDGPAVIASVRDVSATRALQQRLHDSEELFRQAFDRAPTGMSLLGLRGADRGRFLRVNRAMSQLTGYGEADLLGRDLAFLSHPDDQPESAAAVDGFAQGTREHFRTEKRYRHADGHDLWVHVSASVVRDQDGAAAYTVAQVEDITARKRAEQVLARQARHDAEIAQTLQRALLPYDLLAPAGVALAARYRTAQDRAAQIGGDWYDAVALPTGGHALVIGDVEGHDLTAASVMGLVRGAVRSYALEGHPPSVVVQQVNAFLFSAGIERLVTLAYLQLYPDDHLLTVTLAGHGAPLVVPHDGGPVTTMDLVPGLPLGVERTARWSEQTLLVPPDVTIALYTDGLLDYPGSPEDALARLQETARTVAGQDAETVADTLLRNAPAYDDAAVLVARLGLSSAPAAARTLPAQAISATIARLWISDLLSLWGTSGRFEVTPATADQVDTAQLLVTELVSNATRHSDLTVGLRAELDGHRLRLDVSDSSHRMPVLRHPGGEETSGRGLALLDVLASSWGVDLDGQGKRVWFELDLTAAAPGGTGSDGQVDGPVDEEALLAAFTE